jgi:septal ring factor EnvC (AmiA/AmiB activator)
MRHREERPGRPRRSASLGGAMLAWMVLGATLLPLAAAAQPKKDELATEQRRLRQTQRQLREERERAAEARKREASVLAHLEEIDRALARRRREVAERTRQLAKVRAEIAALRADIERLDERKIAQQQALGNRLRALYRIQARGGALPLLLEESDPVRRAVVLRHLTTLTAVDARVIRGYLETTDQLVQRRTREETRRADYEALRASAERERAAMDREGDRRRALLARVRDERAYHERMVQELSEAAIRLEALLRTLQEKQRRAAKALPPSKPGTAATGFSALRGGLPWPAPGRLVGAYGAQVHPRFGTRTFRSGIDIEAAEGTDVSAVYGGKVVFTGWFKGYGNLIVLDHGDEYYTVYAHVAEIGVKEGETVRQGQRIGTVGDTGSLTGPRLYFEVRHQGKSQDPERWLRQPG